MKSFLIHLSAGVTRVSYDGLVVERIERGGVEADASSLNARDWRVVRARVAFLQGPRCEIEAEPAGPHRDAECRADEYYDAWVDRELERKAGA